MSVLIKGRAAGFTFIETMVAMGLLAFIVGDMALVTMYASRSSAQAQRLAVAVTLAENAMEQDRSKDFNNLVAATDCFTLKGKSATCGSAQAVFSRTRTLTPAVIAGSDLSADLDVVVAWVNPRGEADQFRLSSVISRY